MAIDPRKRRQERKEKGWSDSEPMPWLGYNELQEHGEKHPAAVVMHEWWDHTNADGDTYPVMTIYFMVVKGECTGYLAKANLWFSEKGAEYASDTLADIAIALGWEDPFDEEDDEDLQRVFGHGLLTLVMRAEEDRAWENDDGEEIIPVSPRFYNPTRTKITDEMKTAIVEAEGYVAGLIERNAEKREKRAQEPKPKRGKSSGRRSSGGGGSSRGRRSEADEDVPF